MFLSINKITTVCSFRQPVTISPGHFDQRTNEILKEVIGACPEILLEVCNSCLREGRFFADWKKQRLILLRKGNKPLGDASSYRPICPLDMMGKVLEEMILQRLQGHMVRENDLSENQFGFRKAGPQLTPSRQWWTSPLKQEEELVSVRDSARSSALTYATRSIPRDGTSASRRWCGKRFQTTCCE